MGDRRLANEEINFDVYIALFRFVIRKAIAGNCQSIFDTKHGIHVVSAIKRNPDHAETLIALFSRVADQERGRAGFYG